MVSFHPDKLLKELEMVIHSQKLFNDYKDTLHLTDIQKAVGTLIKYGCSFYARIRQKKLIDRIIKLRERFTNVDISKALKNP